MLRGTSTFLYMYLCMLVRHEVKSICFTISHTSCLQFNFTHITPFQYDALGDRTAPVSSRTRNVFRHGVRAVRRNKGDTGRPIEGGQLWRADL